jgi:hypothetical protein
MESEIKCGGRDNQIVLLVTVLVFFTVRKTADIGDRIVFGVLARLVRAHPDVSNTIKGYVGLFTKIESVKRPGTTRVFSNRARLSRRDDCGSARTTSQFGRRCSKGS